MSIPAYSTYKDSSVEWLGEVPTDWVVSKLGYFFREPPCYGVLVPDFEHDGVPMLRITDMEHEFIDTSGLVTISAGLSAQYSRTIIKEGDVVLSLVGTIGKAFEVGPKLAGVNLSRAIARIQLDGNTLPRYLCWIFQSRAFTHFIDLVCRGTAQRVLNLSDLSAFSFVFPTYVEQSSISAFLDYETARIDALIEEQQRLIELLKEKRQAVISHAVTKGLDPTVQMKDSGVEWLGEVPAHWEVGGLTRFIGPVVDYRGRTPTKVDDGIFLVTARNIRNGRIDYEASEEYADPESAESLLARGRPEIGDLLFTMEAPLGQVALIDRTDIALAQRIVKFRGEASVMRNHYLMFWFMSTNCQARLETLATGSTALGIKSSKLGMIECLAPTLNEQDAIVSHIQRESEKNDALVYEAESVIGLLQERRSALVSAAVTGKIDVRGWQPPANAPSPELAQEAV